MHETQLQHNHRLVEAEKTLHAAAAATADIERYQPAVLNAIASTNGTARLLRREQAELREKVTSRLDALSDAVGQVRSDFEPHIETLAWLLGRVETIRAEMLHELRYGRDRDATETETIVVRPDALTGDDIRLNLGCGHLPLDGFVNVDMRQLPGVDIVAPVDDLPFEPASIAEIFSAHVLEHFPEIELSRHLLPYWVGLLRPRGTFRAVVPDLPSMIQQYVREDIDFESLRQVAYGGQEYEGDFHYTAFTTDRLGELMEGAGLTDIEVIATGRPNGDCLEFEISGRRST
jgi:hypothetical protein